MRAPELASLWSYGLAASVWLGAMAFLATVLFAGFLVRGWQ